MARGRATARVCTEAGCPDTAIRMGRCPAHARTRDQYQARTVPTKMVRNSEQRMRSNVVAEHIRVHGYVCWVIGEANIEAEILHTNTTLLWQEVIGELGE